MKIQINKIRNEKIKVKIYFTEIAYSYHLFEDDMILYIDNSKDAARKLLELINESLNLKVTKLIHRNPLH